MNDSDLDDQMEADNKSTTSDADVNTTMDPLSTVLHTDLGLSK